MDVGGDRVRPDALGNRGFGDGVVEAAAAVADVEDDAALLRGEGGRQQLAVLDDVGALAGVAFGRPYQNPFSVR